MCKVLKRKRCASLVVELNEEPCEVELPQTKGNDIGRATESFKVFEIFLVFRFLNILL